MLKSFIYYNNESFGEVTLLVKTFDIELYRVFNTEVSDNNDDDFFFKFKKKKKINNEITALFKKTVSKMLKIK